MFPVRFREAANERFEKLVGVFDTLLELLEAFVFEDLENGDLDKVVKFAYTLKNVDVAFYHDQGYELQAE